MNQNKTFTLIVIVVIALIAGIFIGNITNPSLAPAKGTYTPNIEAEGQVVLMGTSGIFPDGDPVLKTNYYSGTIISYIKPDFQNILNNRACFAMTYIDKDGKVIPLSRLPPGVAPSICVGEGDNGFSLEVLKLSSLTSTTGRVVVTAPQIP